MVISNGDDNKGIANIKIKSSEVIEAKAIRNTFKWI